MVCEERIHRRQSEIKDSIIGHIKKGNASVSEAVGRDVFGTHR